MRIDREKMQKRFAEYAKNYDISNPKVALKVAHTYRVSGVCEEIAKSLNLSEEDVDLAWTIGLLHDIGRFEQLRIFNTFSDGESVEHAKLSCDLLFGTKNTKAGDGTACIRDYVEEASWDKIIYTAIYNHSFFRIEEGVDDRTGMFCKILRDADKIDILRANIETPFEDIYNVTTEELYHSEVSEGVMQSFYEQHATLRANRKTAVDFIAAMISFAFELEFPRSRELILEQGYLEQLMAFPSQNEKTKEQFREIRSIVLAWLKNS